jgi:predicted ATP-binding protein involved in virulence
MSVKMMRVQRLELTHFRGIRHLTLDFPENVTVLVGVNGAGKTSILEALRASLALLLKMVQQGVSEGVEGRALPNLPPIMYDSQGPRIRELSHYLQESDIQAGQRALSLVVDARTERSDLAWSITAQSTLPGEIALHGTWNKLTEFAYELAERVDHDPLTPVPLAIYYAARHSAPRGDPPSKEEDFQNQLAAYENALTGSGLSSTSAFVSWFRRREDYENEKRLDVATFRDSQLQAVRRAVEELLPGFSAPRIRRQPMRMVVRKGDTEVDIKHLSDGERYLLTLGADIARRLALANPTAAQPELCSAIVLIDEIETHLHPSWQRRVVPALTRAFPNSQFIITTHSPQVLSEVRPECIYMLHHEDGELRAMHPDASFGRDSNRILEDLMGADERPSEIKQKLSSYFDLIDQGKMDEARSIRQELESLIGSDEPEFTRADAILRTRELLSR